MSQIIDYDTDSSLESTDLFLIDGDDGTRTVPFPALVSNVESQFGFELLDNTDLDSITDGPKYAKSNCTNKPGTSSGFIFQKTVSDTKIQYFLSFDGVIFYRKYSSSAWSTWTYPYTDMKVFELNGTTLTITDTM